MSIGGDVEGLEGTFKARLDQLATVCNITVGSGYRSNDEQAALYQQYLNGTGNLAAPPGKSNHNHGLAADIDGDKSCAHANAARFGLHFPVAGEDWHVEPVDIADLRSGEQGPAEFTDSQGQPMAAPRPADPIPTIFAAVTAALSKNPDGSTVQAPGSLESFAQGIGQIAGKQPVAEIPVVPGSPGTEVASGPISGTGIFEKILNGIGAPVSPENLRLLDAWSRAEGMPANANNPLATTEGNTPGVVGNHNSVGVKLYADEDTGAQATVKTLLNGRYDHIVAAMRASDLSAAAIGIQNSPWGTGGLVRQILGV